MIQVPVAREGSLSNWQSKLQLGWVNFDPFLWRIEFHLASSTGHLSLQAHKPVYPLTSQKNQECYRGISRFLSVFYPCLYDNFAWRDVPLKQKAAGPGIFLSLWKFDGPLQVAHGFEPWQLRVSCNVQSPQNKTGQSFTTLLLGFDFSVFLVVYYCTLVYPSFSNENADRHRHLNFPGKSLFVNQNRGNSGPLLKIGLCFWANCSDLTVLPQ